MHNKNLNNQGVALVTVVLFFLVLVILLGGVMFSSISNQGNAILSKDHSSAYYTAESGLNISMEKFMQYLIDENYDEIPYGEFASFKADLQTYLLTTLNGQSGTLSGTNPQGTYSILVTKIDDENYSLKSIGTVNEGTVNEVSRTIEGIFTYETIDAPLAKAVIAKGSITMANNANIIGPIASLMQDVIVLDKKGNPVSVDAEIDVHGCPISEVYVPDIDDPNIDVGSGSCITLKEISHEVTFNAFTVPVYPAISDLQTVTVTGNTITFPALGGKVGYYIPTLDRTALNYTDIKFDLGTGLASPVKLYVGNVTTASNGTTNIANISVVGSGELMVHITVDAVDTSGNPNYYFSWASNVNAGIENMTKFQLVIRKGTGFGTDINPVFTIPNNNTFIGSILMDYVDVYLGNMTYKGFIGTLGKSITTSSNANISGPMWVYAPNATVEMGSNSIINGSIMANTVNITSGATIDYEVFTGDVPFKLDLPIFMGGEMMPIGISFKFSSFKEV